MVNITFSDLKRKEPSISTILTSFENSFDPYGALSTPLYQTATFKQVFQKYWALQQILKKKKCY
jgi:hypothetical protein